jgi:hypothetical protein
MQDNYTKREKELLGVLLGKSMRSNEDIDNLQKCMFKDQAKDVAMNAIVVGEIVDPEKLIQLDDVTRKRVFDTLRLLETKSESNASLKGIYNDLINLPFIKKESLLLIRDGSSKGIIKLVKTMYIKCNYMFNTSIKNKYTPLLYLFGFVAFLKNIVCKLKSVKHKDMVRLISYFGFTTPLYIEPVLYLLNVFCNPTLSKMMDIADNKYKRSTSTPTPTPTSKPETTTAEMQKIQMNAFFGRKKNVRENASFVQKLPKILQAQLAASKKSREEIDNSSDAKNTNDYDENTNDYHDYSKPNASQPMPMASNSPSFGYHSMTPYQAIRRFVMVDLRERVMGLTGEVNDITIFGAGLLVSVVSTIRFLGVKPIQYFFGKQFAFNISTFQGIKSLDRINRDIVMKTEYSSFRKEWWTKIREQESKNPSDKKPIDIKRSMLSKEWLEYKDRVQTKELSSTQIKLRKFLSPFEGILYDRKRPLIIQGSRPLVYIMVAFYSLMNTDKLMMACHALESHISSENVFLDTEDLQEYIFQTGAGKSRSKEKYHVGAGNEGVDTFLDLFINDIQSFFELLGDPDYPVDKAIYLVLDAAYSAYQLDDDKGDDVSIMFSDINKYLSDCLTVVSNIPEPDVDTPLVTGNGNSFTSPIFPS